MKKILILAITVGLWSCNPNGYVIDGKVAGLDDYVYLLDEQGTPIDSTYAEKGVFRIKGTAEAPSINYLCTGPTAEQSFNLMLILEPGDIFVNGNIDQPREIVTGGTPANNANNAYTKESTRLAQLFHASSTTPEERAALDSQHTELSRKALTDNRNNLFGALVLAQQLTYEMRAVEILDAVAAFPEALQQTELLLKVKTSAQNKLRTEVGQPYIDIVQSNAAGESMPLKSVIETPANKYVLVDFWASWCMPCMAEIPYLLEDYKNYHSKGFEIYAVSLDTDRDRWISTVGSKAMNWLHVSDLKRFDNQAARDYAVNSIPSNYLIDCSTGKIVAVNLRGKALGEKLAELLQ